ncbi:hypothetical protein ES703_124193 [subsurface metagenome]
MSVIAWDDENKMWKKVHVTPGGELRVYIEHVERIPHYVELPTGVPTEVWKPDTDKSIHVTSILVSVESPGVVEILKDATPFMKMHFNEKRAVPLGLGGDLTFDANVILNATFTADGADGSGYITAVGHEH